MSYDYHKIKASMNLEGVGAVDITQFSVVYGINSVPTATMVIPSGSPVLTLGGATSDALSSLTRRRAVQINLDASGAVKGKGIGLVFDGYTTSLATSATPGAYGVQLAAVNWLDNMRGTSVFSDTRTPTSCYDFESPAPITDGTGVDPKESSFDGVINAVSADLTEGNLYPTIYQLSHKLAAGGLVYASALPNSSALLALSRLSGLLQLGFELYPTTQLQIASLIAKSFYDLYFSGVLWDAWMAAADHFMFMLVPGITAATVGPHDPMYQIPALTIDTDEYVYIRNASITRRTVAGLVLLDNVPLSTNGATVFPETVSVAVAGPKDATGKVYGMLDAAPIPAWLSSTPAPTNSSRTCNIIDGIRVNAWEGAIIVPPSGKSVEAEWLDERDKVQEVAANYARAVMGDRMFGDNTISIVGPLRLDVSPGMIVAVKTMGITGSTRGAQTYYGFVNNVKLDVNCDTSSATTTIMLSHVRNEQDNIDYGLDTSTLYAAPFTPGGLRDDTGGSLAGETGFSAVGSDPASAAPDTAASKGLISLGPKVTLGSKTTLGSKVTL